MSTDSGTKEEEWKYQQESVMFRRGQNMAAPEKEFLHIAQTLETQTRDKDKYSVMVIGVARGEEPLSLLTLLNTIAEEKGKTLQEFADMHTVDIRPQLQPNEIDGTTYKWIIEDVLDNTSLILSSLEESEDDMKWQVVPEVRSYLSRVVIDPSLSKWNTSVQEYVRSDDKTQYDCISYNNVHGHIEESEGRKEILPGLIARLKPGGVIVTDGDYRDIVKKHQDYLKMQQEYGLKELFPGIFQRTI